MRAEMLGGNRQGRTTVAWAADGARILVTGCPASYLPVVACPPSIVEATNLRRRDLSAPVTKSAWTPDGQEIVEAFAQGPRFHAVDGSGDRQLSEPGMPYPPDHLFSPDGGRMLLRPPSSGLRLPYIRVIDVADGRLRAELADEQQVPSVLGWKGDQALLVAREEPGALVLYAVPLDGSPRQRLLSVAIRDEGFGASSWLVPDWFTGS